jgi:hypothetical protein
MALRNAFEDIATEATLAALEAKTPALAAGRVPVALDEPIDAVVSGSVSVSGAVEVSNDAGNPLPVSGTVSVSNFPATQPVSAASLPLPTDAATETSLSALLAATPAPTTGVPDNNALASAARLVGQDIETIGFVATGAGLVTPKMTQMAIGTGVGVSQASGSLLITSGTTANAEYLARSVKAWRGSWLLRYSSVLSQRIINQNFAVIMADLVGENLTCTINSATSITVALPGHTYTAANVGQFMFVGGIAGAAGVPGRYAIASVVAATSITFTVAGWPASGSCTLDLFGHSHVKHLYNGAVATTMQLDAQREGWASGDTAQTVFTSAAPGHIFQTHVDGRNIFWSDTVRASTATPNVTARASRFENIPDDNLDLYVFLWSYNGTTAPASTTTWTVGFISVEKFANLPVYIQGNRLQGNHAALPVGIVGTPAFTLSGTGTVTGDTRPLTSVGVTVEASSAQTVSGPGTATTNATGSGAFFFVNVTAITGAGASIAYQLQVQDPLVTANWIDVPGAVTATLTAIGSTMLCVAPGLNEVANAKVNYPLPRAYRFRRIIAGTTPSVTSSVSAQYVI